MLQFKSQILRYARYGRTCSETRPASPTNTAIVATMVFRRIRIAGFRMTFRFDRRPFGRGMKFCTGYFGGALGSSGVDGLVGNICPSGPTGSMIWRTKFFQCVHAASIPASSESHSRDSA